MRGTLLAELRDLIDWDRFTDRFVTMYVGKAKHGRPPYHPVLVFQCLLLAYLYNLSERSVGGSATAFEAVVLDVGMSDPTPDHSTLSLFRSRRSRRSRVKRPRAGPESKKRYERIEGSTVHL